MNSEQFLNNLELVKDFSDSIRSQIDEGIDTNGGWIGPDEWMKEYLAQTIKLLAAIDYEIESTTD